MSLLCDYWVSECTMILLRCHGLIVDEQIKTVQFTNLRMFNLIMVLQAIELVDRM